MGPLHNSGHKVFDRTEIKQLKPSEDSVELITTTGHNVSCQYVIVATGYASQKLLKQNVASNRAAMLLLPIR